MTEEEKKKLSDEANKKNDELIEAFMKEKKMPGEVPKEDSERAAILNQIYNEKFQLTVRKTPAQEAAEKLQETHQETHHQSVKK